MENDVNRTDKAQQNTEIKCLEIKDNMRTYFNFEPKAKKAKLQTWLWLANALGYASAQSYDVLREYDDIDRLLSERFTQDLSQFFTPAQIDALKLKEPEDFVSRINLCKEHDVNIVTFEDEEYPELLRNIDSPPPVLYYRGDIKLVNGYFTLAIVGTRRPSAYGTEATRTIANGLAKEGAVLVSGLAEGLDSECHKASLQNSAATIACIAFGHDYCYPAVNKKLKELIENYGLVIGEYPPGTQMQKPFFLQRNRLIAGLSHGLCVAEARVRSGTLNTVSSALKYGRDVFSVPGSIFSPLCEGTNKLLKEGAVPATSHIDILQWYGYEISEEKKKSHIKVSKNNFTGEQKKVYEALSIKPQQLQNICIKCDLPVQNVMAILTKLELDGIVKQQAGRQFLLTDTCN